MKTLLVNGSPNARGCTFTALSEVASALNEEGVDTEIIHVGHLDIRGCIGCRKCKTEGKCVFDDIVNEVAPKFVACDGIVLGSPVYFAGPSGGMKAFADRLFYSIQSSKRMKVGAAVVSARRGGTTAAFDVLNKYFTISEMPIAASGYWNMVHGYTPEDVYADKEGVWIMRALGKNMAFLMKGIALARVKYGLPETGKREFTNFIR
ncbi:MAG TPA: flavodoxin family protein [Clostridia bacterium]|jgi:multimeric flavodoxin WrbA|nr:flavodoxin family protein [Clostridia bacterium]HPY42749.1 flavodoxin family protein [Clostridia bacterium]HQA96575.1 flavodoxin family protein [Clostridia bacterium]HQO54722.1 flavodoxin family protein [Clostridia bacterium]HUM60082.1 flavodoxin family protein [Clostridia bacterium]